MRKWFSIGTLKWQPSFQKNMDVISICGIQRTEITRNCLSLLQKGSWRCANRRDFDLKAVICKTKYILEWTCQDSKVEKFWFWWWRWWSTSGIIIWYPKALLLKIQSYTHKHFFFFICLHLRISSMTLAATSPDAILDKSAHHVVVYH